MQYMLEACHRTAFVNIRSNLVVKLLALIFAARPEVKSETIGGV
jgi:hypothetical protein